MFFHALIFAGCGGSCLNTRPIGPVFKHLPRDPTSANAMKNMCGHYSCIFYLIPTQFALKMLLKYGNNVTKLEFISSIDGTDGKQARRTGTSSPLGELFDHGLDSWASFFLPVAVYSVYGRGEYGVSVFRVYLVLLGVNLCFLASHWEKYNTRILYLPWGYDVSQLVSIPTHVIYIFRGFSAHLWGPNIGPIPNRK